MIGQVQQHSHLGSLMILSVIAGCVMWYIFNRTGLINSHSVEKALPANAKSASKTSRFTEALLLLLIAGTILVFIATNRSTNGMLLMLDELSPKFAAVNVAVALCAAVCVLLAAVVCFFLDTRIGVVIAAVVLCIYGSILNGPGDLLESLTGENNMERKVTWTINIGGCDVKGAELWVNGVKLGTMPYITTPDEFKAKVPFWPEEPAEADTEENYWRVPEYSPWNNRGWHSSGRKWTEIQVPDESIKYWNYQGKRGPESKEERKARTYYVQVKYRGEWGYSQGRSGGGNGGKYIYSTTTIIKGARFPSRQKRMETLVDKARLADYRPRDDWFDAIETFGEDAVIAIRLLIEKEPQMEDLLGLWASRKYKLDQVTDNASAWTAFENICDQADTDRAYSTASIAGKAVEMLVPMLDPETLSKKAIKIIRSTNRYSWNSWKLAGKQHFGFANRPEGLRTGSNRTMSEWRGGGRDQLPMCAYAVAHAVWKMDELLDAKDDIDDNIIEQKVVPQFLAQNYDDIGRVKLAMAIGGVDLDNFLLRQKWGRNVDDLPFSQRTRLTGGGNQVNGWLYLASKLKSAAGDEFREKQNHYIRRMLDKSMKHADADAAKEMEFLFVDLDKGEKSLAYKYWRRFSDLAEERHYEFQMKYNYLMEMEPVSSVEMYVKVLRNYTGDYHEVSEAFSKLKRLDDSKKDLVITALRATIKERVPNLSGWSDKNRDQLRDFLLRNLEDILSKQKYAEKILDDLHSENPKASPESVGLWLAMVEPDHLLVTLLAEDEDPELRKSVLDVIIAHPTPTNRAILQKLLSDDDQKVRTAARQTESNIKAAFDSVSTLGPKLLVTGEVTVVSEVQLLGSRKDQGLLH